MPAILQRKRFVLGVWRRPEELADDVSTVDRVDTIILVRYAASVGGLDQSRYK
jgi:hypothetical protein